MVDAVDDAESDGREVESDASGCPQPKANATQVNIAWVIRDSTVAIGCNQYGPTGEASTAVPLGYRESRRIRRVLSLQ